MRSMPVHYAHHRYGMEHANFGLALDVWDRVFGTYRRVRWDPDELGPPRRGFLGVRWW